MTLKQLEVEMRRLDVWSGDYPDFLIEGGADSKGVMGGMLLNVDAPEQEGE